MTKKTTEQNRRMDVPPEKIVPDELNRKITEDDDFDSLVDSIRVLGVLQSLHVQDVGDGTYKLIDGERRWRAATKCGLELVPCEVWSEHAAPGQTVVAGLVLNEQRKSHGCLDVARRLRQIKNEYGQTHEQLAGKTGIPIQRVKNYMAILGASDYLLSFFDEQELPLRVACEFLRYEKATDEASARRLARKYQDSPMTIRELEAARKRDDGHRQREAKSEAPRAVALCGRIEAAFRRNPDAARAELERAVEKLGFRLVAAVAVPQ